MTADKGNGPTLTAAIGQVLSGDVNGYYVIYKQTDEPLRLYVAKQYSPPMDGDFVRDVAIRTHEYAFRNLNRYRSDEGAAFQTWLDRASEFVARKVLVERHDLHRLGPRGRRRYVPLSEPLGEERQAALASPRPGPAEEHEARVRSRRLWEAYERLDQDGRLSVTLHDIEGRSQPETARALDRPLITVRRQLERSHDWLREECRRHDVPPTECEPHYGMVRRAGSDTGYDDDWTASATAFRQDEPDDSDTAVANDEVEMTED